MGRAVSGESREDRLRGDLVQLLQAQRIVDLLSRYARAVDGKDESALAACFSDPVGVQGTAVGPMRDLFASRPGFVEGTQMAAADWAASIMSSMRLKGATQHDIDNHLIEFRGDTQATCSAYMRAIHFAAERPTAGPYEVGGWYRHDLVRQEDDWSIAYWRLEIRWEVGDYAVMASAVAR